MTEPSLDLAAFGAAFSDFVEAMSAAAKRPDSELARRVREHLGADPDTLASTEAEFDTTDHPNLQLALDAVLADAELIGYSLRHPHGGFGGVELRSLLSGHEVFGAVSITPPSRTDVAVGDGRVIRCVTAGIYLATHAGAALVLHVRRASNRPPFGNSVLQAEVLSADADAASSLLADLRAAMREHNVYRGQVISLHQSERNAVGVQFHRIEPLPREALILPDGTLDRLQRHTLGIAEQAAVLTAAGRSLKRGVLLHGPPGTGKTRSVTYLLGAMPGRTTVILTGRGLGLIEQAVGIARDLAPATVVFEDIDLVAAERTLPMAHGGILFELLNQMEGLGEDADLLFILTTNRPDIIEPALAARPGRIDLALEIPLPDAEARARLLVLYGAGIELGDDVMTYLTARTESLTGAFIKELMRQAALRAALEGHPPGADDVRAALDDMLDERSALTRRLLGEPGEASAPELADAGIAGPFPNMMRAISVAGVQLHRRG